MNEDYDSVQWDVYAAPQETPPHYERSSPHLNFTHNSPHGFYSDEFEPSSSPMHSDPPIAASLAEHSGSQTPHHPNLRHSPLTQPPLTNNEPATDSPQDTATVPEAQPMSVRVEDPQKRHEGASSYVAYLLITATSVQTFSSPQPRPVRRRFLDFLWLHDTLTLEFPASIIPPLPDKHRLKYVKGDRFSEEFIERRRLGLQWFIDRIARHPYLQKSQCTRVFLESADFKTDKLVQLKRVPKMTSVLDTLSDTLLNAFAKVKKPDERFVDMRENVDKLQDNLNTIEKLYSRISKRQHELVKNYSSFSTCIQGLSMLEKDAAQPLQQLAKSIDTYTDSIDTMSKKEEMLFLNAVHELLAYCQATKDVLHERDQKQVDFEELSSYLQRAVQERERLLYPGRNMGDRSGMNISEFVADKVNEVRGTDPVRLKEERLLRLQSKIKELQDEVARTNDTNNHFSNQMVKEFNIFQGNKSFELKQSLASYADCHIEFCQKGLSIWEDILPVLEGMKKQDELLEQKRETHEQTVDELRPNAEHGLHQAINSTSTSTSISTKNTREEHEEEQEEEHHNGYFNHHYNFNSDNYL